MPAGLEPRRRMIVGDPTSPINMLITDPVSGEEANVDYDGTYSALAVMDSRVKVEVEDGVIAKDQVLTFNFNLNYAYDETTTSWGRMILETDNDTIPEGQTAQLVIPLMYYYDDKSSSWARWRGDSATGSVYTSVVGIYTPSFHSMCDDTKDALKIVGQETATDNYVTPSTSMDTISINMVYDGTNWDMMRGNSSDGVLVNLGSNNDVTISGTADVDIIANSIGLATSANQLPDDHNVTANAGTNLNTSALALSADQGKWRGAVSGLSTWKEADGKPRISCTDYLYDIAEGNVTAHKIFYKIGFNPAISNVEETVWPYGGKYAFPKGEDTLEIASSDNTQDIGSILFNRTSTSGSTTTLIDTAVDFTAGGTPVAIFDCVILDKAGATPEWGYVTGVTANTLTIAGGFSNGGTADSRDYIVLNKSAHTGCQAVYIGYLDSTFVPHNEIVILNGTTAVPTINSDYYRINDMIVIAAGSLEAPLGTIQLRDVSNTPVYSQISIGYTRARSAVFTVPYGKVLYITTWSSAWASPNDSKVQSARSILRCNREPQNNFLTNSIFYPVAETLVTNESVSVEFDVPNKFIAGTDVTVSTVSSNAAGAGPATTVLRGWVENA